MPMHLPGAEAFATSETARARHTKLPIGGLRRAAPAWHYSPMKITTEPSKETLEVYGKICDEMKAKGAETGNVFGMPAIKRAGKAFAGLFGDSMVFKLSSDSHDRASALAGAALFDPSGMKRPMKAWVVVPGRHRKTWGDFAQRSFGELAEAPEAKAAPKPKPKAKATKATKAKTKTKTKTAKATTVKAKSGK